MTDTEPHAPTFVELFRLAAPYVHAHRERKIPLRFVGETRITDRATMSCVEDAVGHIRGRIEGLFSMGLPSSPMENARLRVASGNFVVARPRGVRDGVDFQYTGGIRRI